MADRILVAPLNWGLGHATRCIPLIRALLRLGCEPVLASDGRALALLRREFPGLPAEPLPGYGIRYGGGGMVWSMGRQLPRIGLAVWREQQEVRRLAGHYQLQGILSDNRYGCFHPAIPSAFISHQLHIRVPHPAAAAAVNRLQHFFIRRFDECWVPDRPGEDNLSGALSRPGLVRPPTYYLGLLSRLAAEPAATGYELLVMLSGPEPQRSRLEKKLLRQAVALDLRALFVLGKTEYEERRHFGRVAVVSYLGGEALREALAAAELVVCRSGYSTLMDLAALGKKALLVPTPGQTEQRYLAQRAGDRGWCVWREQAAVDLAVDVPAARLAAGMPHLAPADPTDFLRSWLGRKGAGR